MSAGQLSMLLIAALPYVGLLIYLFVTGKIREMSSSSIFLGLFDIVIAIGAGIAALFIVVAASPQTNSSITGSFLTGVFAIIMAVALFVGEFFRFIILRPSGKEEKPKLSGLSFGVGMSIGEFVAFAIMLVANKEAGHSSFMPVMLITDILLLLAISVVCFEMIQQGNYATFAVGGLYYLSLFFMVAFASSTVLTIVAKVLLLAVAIALFIVYLPHREEQAK